MPDYDVDIGGSTTLRIRDLGQTVEYWVRTGQYTYNYQQPWSYFVNGVDSDTQYFRMLQGGQWQRFASFEIEYDQSIRFTIYDEGLGFPTYDYWVHILRDTVPEAPEIYAADATSSSNIRVKFSLGYDGGSAIVQKQVGYGTNRDSPQFYVDTGGPNQVDVGGLSTGVKYYFWARVKNATGWSPWSNRGEDTTFRTSNAPRAVTFTNIAQTSVTARFRDNGDGGSAILERQFAYSLDPDVKTTTVTATLGYNNISGLSPGRVYYFWARARNSIGWSSWSDRSQVMLVAGARVRDGGQWKRAVPFVRVAGVWKVAMPWVKSEGTWKAPTV